MNENYTELIIYQTEDGRTKINVRMENDTVWLTQTQMAELSQRDRSVISKHIKNVFSEGEIPEESNVHYLHIANSDKPVAYYSIDVIISVEYRVKSLRGTQLRIWASSVLKEYLIKGFTMNDDLLKRTCGGDYFDELLERIRDICSFRKSVLAEGVGYIYHQRGLLPQRPKRAPSSPGRCRTKCSSPLLGIRRRNLSAGGQTRCFC